MSIFFTDAEKALVARAVEEKHPQVLKYFWATVNLAAKRAAQPGLITLGTQLEWWFVAQDYLAVGALAYNLKPSDSLKTWLRDMTISILHRPEDDWIGPFFRDHDSQPALGHLETAHLTICVALMLDLVPEIFTEDERAEITSVLRERAIPMCQRWIEKNKHVSNWRAVMASGVAVAAAVINDREALRYALEEYRLCAQAFQPDGSYGEGLNYANYCAHQLMYMYEALVRRDPALAAQMSLEPYVFHVRWAAQSVFYVKTFTRWGQNPMARFANFNDSGAVSRPSADLMLQIAARARQSHPAEAGLARWLFDACYQYPNQPSFANASFGDSHSWNFLTLPFLVQAAEPASPEAAGLPTLESFSVGDVLARDRWGGQTILAVHGGKDPIYGPGHLHGDLNSFILVHRDERLLADPGHSCYRNIIHGIETSSVTHNTCTFTTDASKTSWYIQAQSILQQNTSLVRAIRDTQLAEPVDRGGRHLLTQRLDEVAAIGCEAAQLYGHPIEEFSRFFLLIGAHILYIVDFIRSAQPVRTDWNFLLNNRDGMLDMKISRETNTVIARRGDAGMKLINLSKGVLGGPYYSYMHDSYHPLPNQPNEGVSGSGYLMRWTEPGFTTDRAAIHAAALDDYGGVAGWHVKERDGWSGLEAPGGQEMWGIKVNQNPASISLRALENGREYRISQDEQGRWRFIKSF